MRRPRKKTISKGEQRSLRRRGIAGEGGVGPVEETPTPDRRPPTQEIALPATIVMKDLADRLGLQVGKLLTAFIRQGVMVTINSSVDFDTAALIIEELGFQAKPEERKLAEAAASKSQDASLTQPRPPVVTVMGHVDHGKTSLLDAIRKTDVARAESGGITQHIGAYQVEIPQQSQAKVKTGKSKTKTEQRVVTFLDTPGHEAFAALRAHGANLTDIVILVVAADDGVRPQTLEALSHARAANVPIIVALTKIDLPGADLAKVKAELAEHQLVAEEWGGKTPMVAVSSKTKTGIPELLDLILLVADLEDFRARAEGPAEGVVIESHQEVGLGPVATVLLQQGTLQPGDVVASDQTFGRVRSLRDWRGHELRIAQPSAPVQIAGLKSVPVFGDRVQVVSSEKAAHQFLEQRGLGRVGRGSVASGELSEEDFPVILKADTQGSVEALKNVLRELTTGDIQAKILSSGIGPVADSDVHLAAATKATILAFGVPTLNSAKQLAGHHQTSILAAKVIYELVDAVAKAMTDRLSPVTDQEEIGRLKVLQVFSTKHQQTVLGGMVTKGRIEPGTKIRIRREGPEVGTGTIISLRQGPNQIQTIGEGQEVGLGIEATIVPVVGDIIDVIKEEVRERSVSVPTKAR